MSLDHPFVLDVLPGAGYAAESVALLPEFVGIRFIDREQALGELHFTEVVPCHRFTHTWPKDGLTVEFWPRPPRLDRRAAVHARDVFVLVCGPGRSESVASPRRRPPKNARDCSSARDLFQPA